MAALIKRRKKMCFHNIIKKANKRTFTSAQPSPMKATFLFPYTVAIDVDLILSSTSTAYLVQRWKKHYTVSAESQIIVDMISY